MSDEERVRITERSEKKKIAQIQKQYQESYNSIRKEIADFELKYGVDGKLSMAEAQKFNRLQNLEKAVGAELAKIDAVNVGKMATYAADIHEFNYLYEGYVLESKYQIKLSYSQLNREAVKASALNPLDKVTLLNNKQQLTQRVNSAITQGIVKGDSIAKTAKLVRQAMETNANNATRIVRTETTKAMNEGEMESMNHAADRGLPIQKEWLATLDSSTRDSHAAVDGEVRDLDKTFSNGLMFPGDPAGGAAEVINCRCTMTEKIKDLDLPDQSRRAREDGGTKIIPKMSFEEWQKGRVG